MRAAHLNLQGFELRQYRPPKRAAQINTPARMVPAALNCEELAHNLSPAFNVKSLPEKFGGRKVAAEKNENRRPYSEVPPER
jgi:hypothetical protein